MASDDVDEALVWLDRLDDDSGWAFEVDSVGRLPVIHGTAETVDEVLAEVRRIIAERLDVDPGAFVLDVIARIDEHHARLIDGLHNIGGLLDEPPRGRGRHRRPPS